MNQVRFLVACAGVAWLAGVLPQFFDGSWVGWVVTIPGTILHEAAHYIFALHLFGSPGEFSVFPSFENGQMVSYGHITFVSSNFNAATVALSPILLGPAGVWIMAVSTRFHWAWKPLAIWAAVACFYSAWPSSVDWAIALSYPLSFVVAIPILIGSVWIWWRLVRIELHRTFGA